MPDLAIAGLIPFSATDWPDHLTATIFTQGCPWRCTYCHNPTLQPFRSGEVTFADVLDHLDQRRELLDGLVISGGEPTAQPHLPHAIAATHHHGFKVGLHTCGYSPKRLAALLDAPATTPDWIGIDIKALPADLPAVVGRPAHIAAASWQSLRIVAASGIDCQIRTTVWPNSILEKHLPQLQDEVAALGHTLHVQWARGVDAEGVYMQQAG